LALEMLGKNEEITGLRLEIERLQEEVFGSRVGSEDGGERTEELMEEILKLKKIVEVQEGRVRDGGERNEILENEKITWFAQKIEFESEKMDLDREKGEIQGKFENLQAEMLILAKQVTKLESRVERTSLDSSNAAEVENLRATLAEKSALVAELQESKAAPNFLEFQRQKGQLNAKNDKIAKLTEKLKQKQDEIKKLASDNNLKIKELEDLSEKLSTSNNEFLGNSTKSIPDLFDGKISPRPKTTFGGSEGNLGLTDHEQADLDALINKDRQIVSLKDAMAKNELLVDELREEIETLKDENLEISVLKIELEGKAKEIFEVRKILTVEGLG
jgi:chromosome segregation ATPase